MKRYIVLLLAIVLTFSAEAKKKKREVEGYNYELSLSKESYSSTSGFKVFKVWSYCKKKEMATMEVCMKNAIHGVLFKGLGASDTGTQGTFPPLCPSGYDQHKEYFDNFFKSGDYKQYIQQTSKGSQQAGDAIKTTNKEWKVGMLVQVNVNTLRKRLEADGIIQGAQDLFSK